MATSDEFKKEAERKAQEEIEKQTRKKEEKKKNYTNKDVEYYLEQIPFSEEQQKKSNEQIADALFKMGLIYKEKIEDFQMANQTFEDFQKRFPKEERVPETIFHQYLMASKKENYKKAQKLRNQLVLNHLDNKYTKLLKSPNYINERKQILIIQDSIYAKTYKAYTKGKFDIVFKNVNLIDTKYPYASLRPMFAFLKTLSIGKTKSSKEFEKSLNELVEKYPQTDISAMSKDMLALIKQGYKAQKGATHGSLIEKRKELVEKVNGKDINALENDRTGRHRLLLLTNANEKAINKLQYNLAIFNFSKFLIKNFGFEKAKLKGENTLSVKNLSSYEEAIWYHNTLVKDSSLVSLIDSMKIRPIAISENNFEKLKKRFTVDEYLTFEKDSLQKGMEKEMLYATFDVPKKEISKEVPKVKEKPKTVEIIDKATELFPKLDTVKVDTISQKQNTEVREQKSENRVDKTEKSENKEQEKEVKDKKKEQQKVEKNTIEKSRKENIKKFKGLFIYRKESSLLVVMYIPKKRNFDDKKIITALEKLNKENYQIMNLKVSKNDKNVPKTIKVGNFNSKDVAKAYLLKMIRNSEIKQATSGVSKRNLIITEENLEILLNNPNSLKTYFEFMKKYYLK